MDLIIYAKKYVYIIQCKYRSSGKNKIGFKEVSDFEKRPNNFFNEGKKNGQFVGQKLWKIYAVSSYEILDKDAVEFIKSFKGDEFSIEVIPKD